MSLLINKNTIEKVHYVKSTSFNQLSLNDNNTIKIGDFSLFRVGGVVSGLRTPELLNRVKFSLLLRKST